MASAEAGQPLARRFPAAEARLRDRLEDFLMPSEELVGTTVTEDAQGACWVSVTCALAGFRTGAAFAAADLETAGGAWPLWLEGAVAELERRLRERAKSGW